VTVHLSVSPGGWTTSPPNTQQEEEETASSIFTSPLPQPPPPLPLSMMPPASAWLSQAHHHATGTVATPPMHTGQPFLAPVRSNSMPPPQGAAYPYGAASIGQGLYRSPLAPHVAPPAAAANMTPHYPQGVYPPPHTTPGPFGTPAPSLSLISSYPRPEFTVSSFFVRVHWDAIRALEHGQEAPRLHYPEVDAVRGIAVHHMAWLRWQWPEIFDREYPAPTNDPVTVKYERVTVEYVFSY
jgi:hypothetical protein